ncbi:ArsR/SmtB family transcription factor [Plantactinospora sp. GCM10030261]|uniref:ArsR/SmtB family transcription factor n=1 Tax=Plantactinospora sp. GCM10030261 TaxID=3273420 RepID=UPI00360ECCD4
MTDPPLDEMLEVSRAEQFKALGHPFRQRLLFSLGQQPATISQLAAALDARKGNVAHHLKVLREAGMVRIVETRRVRGGTEQYYQRTARRLKVTTRELAPTAAFLGAVAEEIAAADAEPLLTLRHVRLTAAQADRLTAALTDLVDGAEDAGAGKPRYGLLVGLFRHAPMAADLSATDPPAADPPGGGQVGGAAREITGQAGSGGAAAGQADSGGAAAGQADSGGAPETD